SSEERTARLQGLLRARGRWYRRCDLRFETTVPPEVLAERVVERVLALERTTVAVRLPAEGYRVHVEPSYGGLGDALARRLPPAGAAAQVALIVDPNAAEHAAGAEAALQGAGYAVRRFTMPGQEEAKSLETVRQLIDALLAAGMQRGSPVISLGGGVTGDVAGFVAAVLHRGVPVVHLPTTLLAMVDAAVGGKTGVNHPTGKNLIGAFHQPRLVWAALDSLRTLPDREFRAGLAEVVKYAWIETGTKLLADLERQRDAILRRDPACLQALVRRCVALKAQVVEADAGEKGLRRILNLGHTLGHALEAESGYGRLLHGEAVAMGLVAAARLAVALGRARSGFPERVAALLEGFGLPTVPPAGILNRAVDRVLMDKKAAGRRVAFVVPREQGGCEIVDLEPEELRQYIETERGEGR
ncbi:MAG: 3-dehydroquinate synthase, partial [Deltaproteobacteria bacterium]